MSLTVRAYEDGDAQRWDEFVERCESATFFHKIGWRELIREAFGHRCYYLLAEREGVIQGVLPLAQVKSLLFGNSLSSLPFCVYGGIAANAEEVASALRAAACELAQQLQVDAMEFRNTETTDSGWPTKDLYFTFKKQIDADNDVNLKAIPNRQRAMIRKGAANGLVSEETADSKRLYKVYSQSVRNLGTPVFTSRYFPMLQKTFGKDCRILMINDGTEDVAGVMSFYFRGEVLPYYGGSVARARTIKGCNDFMYWELLRRSADEGLVSFDFGRSKAGTGPFKFKKNWGFTPQQIPYEYFLVRASEMPNVNPNNPKYKLMVDNWKRLPLFVANFIGPWLAKDLG
jgi:FemAB-related protein (PEP-CTERM system-associated)